MSSKWKKTVSANIRESEAEAEAETEKRYQNTNKHAESWQEESPERETHKRERNMM